MGSRDWDREARLESGNKKLLVREGNPRTAVELGLVHARRLHHAQTEIPSPNHYQARSLQNGPGPPRITPRENLRFEKRRTQDQIEQEDFSGCQSPREACCWPQVLPVLEDKDVNENEPAVAAKARSAVQGRSLELAEDLKVAES